MSIRTENAMKDVHRYLDELDTSNMTIDEINEKLAEFAASQHDNPREPLSEKTAKTADDFMELAEESDNKSDCFRLAKKALSLEPDNIDAKYMVVDCGSKDPFDFMRKLKALVKEAGQIMEKQGYMEPEYIGGHWQALETRPYMRVCERYMTFLKDMGMLGAAAEQGEEIIRLNKNDNQGVRYVLMHISAHLEREDDANKLLEKYSEHDEIQMIMPMAVLYYKKMDFETSEKYLKRLIRLNKDARRFFKEFRLESVIDEFDRLMKKGMYGLGRDELVVAVGENRYLYEGTLGFFVWAKTLKL
ncbi:MAG: hypothetical protein J5819_06310 [Eubacterium sp.]|nr:hypothetical protein [Eubacterium sp.]